MSRVPFVTDEEKEKYLIKKAEEKICEGCSFLGFCEFGGVQRYGSVKGTVVREVQDLFEVNFCCQFYPDKTVKISKFFLPNENFEKNYIEKIAKISQSSMNINGYNVLDELLKWGRLEIK